MRKLAILLALVSAPATAAVQPYKYEGVEIPKLGVNPDQRRKAEPCLEQQRQPKTMIMLMRTDDGRVIVLGAITVRQRC